MLFRQKRLEDTKALDTAFFARFAREEDGSLTIFSMFLMLAMLLTTGLAVDVMRYESQDTLMRNTADAAVLACADMQQKQDPKTVVEDFFKARGLEHTIAPNGIKVEEGLNFRRCDVEVAANIGTLFIDADIFEGDGETGIKYLSSGKETAAEERITDIEISLVLDVSGSMRGSKMSKLHSAGKDFIDDVIKPEYQGVAGTTSISIIPYNGKVNAGPTLANAFGLKPQFSDGTSVSHCARFYKEDFDSTAFPADAERIAHFDKDTNTWKGRTNKNTKDKIERSFCQVAGDSQNWNEPMVHEIDPDKLKAKIGSLQADGWTAIDTGAKWGVALLDPSSRSNITPLINESISARPRDFFDPETMKVVVIMTDGVNTRQYDLEKRFKTDMSHVYYSPTEDRYVVNMTWKTSGKKWYLPDTNKEVSTPPAAIMQDAYQLSWEDLMGRYNLKYVSKYFYDKWNDWEKATDRADEDFAKNGGVSDPNLLKLCDEARKKQIVLFTVAFSAPTDAQKLLADCVGGQDSGYYYGVNEISDAFDSIASQINHLKLIK